MNLTISYLNFLNTAEVDRLICSNGRRIYATYSRTAAQFFPSPPLPLIYKEPVTVTYIYKCYL